MTKEEYNSLQEQKIEINAQQLHRYKAMLYTYHQYGHELIRICPNCYEAYLVNGYICPCCRYDPSYSLEEWNENQKVIN